MTIRQRLRNSWQSTFGAIILIVAVVSIFSLIPLLFFHRFYFLDDTQRGAIGQWYEVGKLLLKGQLPIFNVAAQGSGNYLAEGQWSTFSPLVWLISIIVYYSSNFLVFATVFKIILLNILGVGAFLLARSMSVQKPYAIIYGIVTPFVGFTIFAGASSWVTDLMVSAFFPWFWWGLRRFLNKNTGPVLAFIIGYSIITVGYVFGTIMLIAVMLGAFIAAIVMKNWMQLRRIILLGISLASVTIAVYLPGIAISGVTMRNTEGIFNDNFLSPSLSDLLFSFSPVGYSEMNSWWTVSGVTYMPFMYIGWLLALLVFVNFKQTKSFIQNHKVVLIQWATLTLLTFMLLFGPANVGPLRFPVRMMAYFGQLMLLLVILLVAKLGLRFTRGRVQIYIGLMVLGTYLEIANTPARVQSILAINLIIGILVAMMAYLGSGHHRFQLRTISVQIKRPMITIVVLAIVTTGFSLLVQERTIGRHNDAIQQQHITYIYPDYQMPATKADILKMADKFRGNTLVLGFDNHVVMGNDWYITNNDSMNVYTPVGFKKFSDDFRGGDPTRISPDNYDKLFKKDKQTQLPLADLLSVDTVVVGNEGDGKVYRNLIKHKNVPAGWQVTSNDQYYVVIQREKINNNVGGIVWSNLPRVTQVKNSNYAVTIKVPAHQNDAKVVFSRTAWPGYHVIGGQAKLAKPLRGYLTKITVPASQEEQTITLQFEPPLFKASVGLIIFSVMLIVLWSIGRVIILVKKQ
ncbi:hypothetical protein [Leuconostoc lactis]|uniref:hypothetical protein n=1 Tax=Leuconostoc lactis TaxID=1246 RepID=UPI0025B00116|nr:hypothetical protein [Leuconostoc lactis]MDN2650374.1 hypothetical protein [Leuconostoc lactis]